jgi:hypothetical protein
MRDPVPENRSGSVRRWSILPGALIAVCILIFAGRFMYSLGQQASSRISRAGVTPHAQPEPQLTPTGTATHPPPTSTDWYFPPTPTATRIPWTSCPGIVITLRDEEDGDFVHVLRCEDGLEYDVGPLSRGIYAVSPDDRYLVYCDLNGIVYAARIGSPALTVIRKTQREFFVFGKHVDPLFELSFSGDGPYVLEVYEKRYAQNLPINMPRWLSE